MALVVQTTTALRPTTSEAVKVKRSHVLRGALMAAAPLTTLLTTRVGGAHAVVDNANKPFVETASGLKVLDAKLGEGATPKAGEPIRRLASTRSAHHTAPCWPANAACGWGASR